MSSVPHDLGGFRHFLELDDYAPKTVDSYVRDVKSYLDFLRRNGEAEASEQSVRLWLRESGRLGRSTVIGKLAALRGYFSRFLGIGDPTARYRRPRGDRRMPRPVTDEQFDRRVDRLDHQTADIAILLRETGLRISELCALRIDLPVPDRIVVRGKGSVDRMIPLSVTARAALTRLGGRMPWGARNIQLRLHKVGLKAITLRHSFATRLAERGVDLGVLQDLMGHASPASTRVYAKYRDDQLRAAIDLLDAPDTANGETDG